MFGGIIAVMFAAATMFYWYMGIMGLANGIAMSVCGLLHLVICVLFSIMTWGNNAKKLNKSVAEKNQGV